MTGNAIGGLIAALKREVRNRTISAATEHHLRRELAAIGWSRDQSLHVAKLDDEVRRLETEARALRELRDATFGVSQEATTAAKLTGVWLPINPNYPCSRDAAAWMDQRWWLTARSDVEVDALRFPFGGHSLKQRRQRHSLPLPPVHDRLHNLRR